LAKLCHDSGKFIFLYSFYIRERRKKEKSEMKTYTLIAFKKRIQVSEAVYKAYYQAYEKERYQNKLTLTHTLPLEKLEASGMSVEAHLSQSLPSTEDILEDSHLKAVLASALLSLSEGERERFLALAYGEATERELSARYQMSKSKIHREKNKTREKLQAYLKAHLA
jgi:hypothetical protein